MAGVPPLKGPPGFELTVVDLDPLRAAISAVGELDLAARDDLAEVLGQQEVARRRIVRLDLSQATFLDCSCLGVIVGSHHRLLKLHGLLVLTGVDTHVARLLKITGLDDTLFVVPGDQDLFGSVLMARVARRAALQRLSDVRSFEELMAVADRLEPTSQTSRGLDSASS